MSNQQFRTAKKSVAPAAGKRLKRVAETLFRPAKGASSILGGWSANLP
jgi:hypothetical protein